MKQLAILLLICCMFACNRPKVINIDVPEVYHINNYVKNINSGGCGFFALKLYRKLNNEKFSIINIGDRRHIVLFDSSNGLYLDANGYSTKLSLQIRIGGDYPFTTITESQLEEMVYCERWNKDFNFADTAIINKYIDNI